MCGAAGHALDEPYRLLESHVLRLDTQVGQRKATLSHETLQCVIMGGFTATTVRLLSPRIPRYLLFIICALMCARRLPHVWITWTWNCPLTGQSGDNSSPDV